MHKFLPELEFVLVTFYCCATCPDKINLKEAGSVLAPSSRVCSPSRQGRHRGDCSLHSSTQETETKSKLGLSYETSRPTPKDYFLQSGSTFKGILNLTKQTHQLGTKCSSIWAVEWLQVNHLHPNHKSVTTHILQIKTHWLREVSDYFQNSSKTIQKKVDHTSLQH